jgi:hypothetical protein
MALASDTAALRQSLERILPPRKDRLVRFDLPPLTTADDAVGAMAAIAAAIAADELSLGEATEASRMIESFVRVVEAGEMERRLLPLEKAAPPGGLQLHRRPSEAAASRRVAYAARRWRLRTRVLESRSSSNNSASFSSMTPPSCSASTIVTARR